MSGDSSKSLSVKGDGFMPRPKDLAGQKFGKLVAIERFAKQGQSWWTCKCDCGNIKNVRASCLVSGATKSCGCYQRECTSKANRKHGENGTRLYKIWKHMKGRCLCKSDKDYSLYGGRGISICESWKESYENFRNWAIQSGYSEKLTLDRVDVDGDYSPENCRWATVKEQANNKRTNIYVTLGNETHTLSEWGEIKGISYATIDKRRRYGWSNEAAVSTPIRKRGR